MSGGMTESGGGNKLKAVGFSQPDCRLACAKMIVLDELSFRFMKQEGFKLFCSVACPKFVIPSRITIARDIMKLYDEEKKKLNDYFVKHSQSVSLTTDTWTSIPNVCYMVLTSHFIDHEWKMQKRILNFCQIPNHKGDIIDKAIEACLKDWGIERVFAITVDNASSNNLAIIHIKKRLQIRKSAICVGDFLHMRCSAHILNLVVGDGFKDLDNSIVVVRNAVRYVRASPSRRIMKWCASDKSILKDMACKMKIKFDKYWGSIEKQNVLLYVAIVIDPQYKQKFVMSCLKKLYSVDEVETIVTYVKTCLSKLVSHYSNEFKLKNPEVSGTHGGSSASANEKSSMVLDSNDEDSFDMFETDFEKECDEYVGLDMTNELDRYLAERHDEERKNKDFDILEWWKMSSSKYPILAMMACDVLAIQVSTVASESAFSTGGRVLDSFQSSLSPTMVQPLICCQNWLRSSSLALDMGSLLEDTEAYQYDVSDNSSRAYEVMDLE